MRTFVLPNGMFILCSNIPLRNGFKHTADLFNGNRILETETKQYDNRTWEKNDYDTVIESLIKKTKVLTASEKRDAITKLNPD